MAERQGVLTRAGDVDAEAVDRFLRAGMAYHKMPGMSVALIKGGRVVYHRSLGMQEAGGDERVKDRTLFEAAYTPQTG